MTVSSKVAKLAALKADLMVGSWDVMMVEK